MKKVLVTGSFSKYSDEPIKLLKENGFEVVKGKECAKFSYKDVKRLVRKRDCVYIYVDKGRAFLLPDSDAQREALERFMSVTSV